MRTEEEIGMDIDNLLEHMTKTELLSVNLDVFQELGTGSVE